MTFWQWPTSQGAISVGEITRSREATFEERALPEGSHGLDEYLFSGELNRHHPPSGFVEVKGAVVSRFLFRTEIHGLPEDWSWDHNSILSRENALLNFFDRASYFFGSPTELAEGLWVGNFHSNNYFHWITEALPRLSLARDAGVAGPVLLPHSPHRFPFLHESLSLLGEDWVELKPLKHYKVHKLWLTSSVSFAGNPRPDVLNDVRRRLLEPDSSHVLRIQKDLPKKVWLTRKNAGRRHLLNEHELTSQIEELGFFVLDPGELSLVEQIEIFKDSELLVGVHGAGLTNMLFMSPGARVIEIRAEGDSHNNCYFAMASACGLKYGYAKANRISNRQHSDLVMSGGQIEALLEVLRG